LDWKGLIFVIGHCPFIRAFVCSLSSDPLKHSGHCTYCQV